MCSVAGIDGGSVRSAAGGALRTRGAAALRGAAGLRAGAFAAGAFAAGAFADAAFAVDARTGAAGAGGTGGGAGTLAAGTTGDDGDAGLRVRVSFGANCFGLTTTASTSAGTGEVAFSMSTIGGGVLSGTDDSSDDGGASASAAVAGGAAVRGAVERVRSRGVSEGSVLGAGFEVERVEVERDFDEDLPLAMMIAVTHGVADGQGVKCSSSIGERRGCRRACPPPGFRPQCPGSHGRVATLPCPTCSGPSRPFL
jgi:hypothetical protein